MIPDLLDIGRNTLLHESGLLARLLFVLRYLYFAALRALQVQRMFKRMRLGYLDRLSIRLPYLVEILEYVYVYLYLLLVVFDLAEINGFPDC